MNTAATAAGCSRVLAPGERQDVSEDGRHVGLGEADRQPGDLVRDSIFAGPLILALRNTGKN